MKLSSTRRFCLGVLLAGAAAAAGAQTYPAKPVRIVVPYAPGAITDTAARLIAERLSVQLGQQFVVENRGGAGTRIGVQHVLQSPPDGYTLLFVNSVTHGSMPAMSKSLPFDPVKDTAPVAPLFWYANVYLCHPSVPFNTIAGLVEYAQKHPGKLTNATAGPGSGHDIQGELFKKLTGIDMLHVHYRGGGPALQDVLAGNVSCIWGDGNAKGLVESGKLKALATAGLQPDANFPGVPTMDAAGVKGFNMPVWQGLAAPAGTPPDIVMKLNTAANEALASAELVRRAKELSLNISGGPPERLGQMMRDDLAKYARIVKDAKIPLQD